MPQRDHVTALELARSGPLDNDIQRYFDKCDEKLGFVPNVVQAYAHKPDMWRAFTAVYHAIMDDEESGLDKLEREMIAVVVSSANRCYYCLVAHGQAVRRLSGDPELGELLVMNYRAAPLSDRQRAMLDYAWKLAETPHLVGEADRAALRAAGFDDRDIFDISQVAGFFSMTNRVAHGVDMMPNREYHKLDR